MKFDLNFFRFLRRSWCYRYSYWSECSYFTKDKRWNNAAELYECKITLLIPFWIEDEDDIAEYYDRWCENDWLYSNSYEPESE